MKNKQGLPQLFLRLALGAGFLGAGLDRFGVWGPAGAPGISWGDWQHFMEYAYKLMSFLPYGVAEFFAAIASGAEVSFGLLLIAGLWTRWAAMGSGLLTFIFAMAMARAFGIQSPLNYSVFTASAGSFLLSSLPAYRWSLDNMLKKRKEANASPGNILSV
ncbi:putative membrane protein YphA (DoxX/SURF4 family) [Chitinophaga niastensis]|uniref:Putative membrane protein YphA (DoxX/SURF4 family) n=1 Tax=Chitinophaga niastensis TaxID=536980 RepID=A0A2P8HES6_CHINA|nr:DoxX family protein [Chitinophaga niastensis]PSL44727.1 putative membrane protein YphA (DoxX/SURF4 family) [Chitinophaga niastensis]